MQIFPREFLVCSAAICAAAPGLLSQSPPTGFVWESVSSGQLSNACSMAFAPDGRLFLVERDTGNIRVLQDGSVQAGAWATLPVAGSLSSEQGLLGIAIDPDFLHNGYVYVYYSASLNENVVARLQEQSGAGTNLTVLTPAGVILGGGNHDAGRLVFGQDGMLYVGTGDTGDNTLPQDLSSWNGKVLRLQPPNLTIPGDNPFPGSPIWSYGHRNQFGLTVNPANGGLYQTENGLNTSDEVNRIVRGGNYGWPIYEGQEPVPDPNTVDPLATWSPPIAPTGTCFYRGEVWPSTYQDNWFVVQYSTNIVTRLVLDATGGAVVTQATFDQLPGNGFDVQMGPDGNLWFLTNRAGGRGADEVGRWILQNGALPTAHLLSVSNRSVGGTVTFGCRGHTGSLFAAWLGVTRFATPVSTPYGNQWVAVDSVQPLLFVNGDERCYLGQSVANSPSLIGMTVHCQAAEITSSLQIVLTNATSLTLH